VSNAQVINYLSACYPIRVFSSTEDLDEILTKNCRQRRKSVHVKNQNREFRHILEKIVSRMVPDRNDVTTEHAEVFKDILHMERRAVPHRQLSFLLFREVRCLRWISGTVLISNHICTGCMEFRHMRIFAIARRALEIAKTIMFWDDFFGYFSTTVTYPISFRRHCFRRCYFISSLLLVIVFFCFFVTVPVSLK